MVVATRDLKSLPKPVGALVAGLRVVRYLSAANAPVGVTQIARDLDLNPSTCFNLLRTLVQERLAVFDAATRKYSLGLGLVELARGNLERANTVRLIRPYIVRLAIDHNVTATLWQRISDDRVVLVDHAESDSAIRIHMSIGQRLPMMIAALGRCMAAHSGLSRKQLARIFAQLRWQNAPSFETYMDQVEEAKRRGYAVDEGHYVKGVTTVSAPVLGPDGKPTNAISAVGFTAQFAGHVLDRLAHEVRDIAREVTRAVSGSTAASQSLDS